MAQKREIPADVLQQAYAQTQQQVAKGGYSPTKDPKFPVLPTFLQTRKIIYFPRTNVEVIDGEEILVTTKSVRHSINKGNFTQMVRCIHGLKVEQLGWNGECPLCQAAGHSWDLYNLKLDKAAADLGLSSRTEDPNNLLKPYKESANKDREVDTKQGFVTTPVVVVPVKPDLTPDPEQAPEVYFLDWRESRWDENIIKLLSALRNAPKSPAGMFFTFDYNYDTKGQQPNPRDAARKMKISIIQDPDHLAMFKPYIEQYEESAKEFTVAKANEVIIANEIMFYDEVEKIAEEGSRKTLKLLEMMRQQQGLEGQGQPQLGMNPQFAQQQGGNALLSFGQPVQNVGLEQGQPPVGQPMGQPMPQMGQPVPPMGQPVPPMGQPVPPMGQPMPQMGQPLGQPVNPTDSPLGKPVEQ